MNPFDALFGGRPKAEAPVPPPQVDSTRPAQDEADRSARRRRYSTVLTSSNGLPNLGTTSNAQAS